MRPVRARRWPAVRVGERWSFGTCTHLFSAGNHGIGLRHNQCARLPLRTLGSTESKTDGSGGTDRPACRARTAGADPPVLRTVEACAINLPSVYPDPFAGDPADPSAALDGTEPGQPLDPQERLAVEEDLADLAVYEALLGHRGIRGLVVCCEDCQQDHYHDWDMLRANLLQLLVDGTVRLHEPAYDPVPDAYVTRDYCRGFADASMNGRRYGASALRAETPDRQGLDTIIVSGFFVVHGLRRRTGPVAQLPPDGTDMRSPFSGELPLAAVAVG